MLTPPPGGPGNIPSGWPNVSKQTRRADHPADLQSMIPKTTKDKLSPQVRRLGRRPLSSTESMTCSRQSREDPATLMKSNQSFCLPKSSTRIGCWNVRSLGNPTKQNSRLRDVLHTMNEKHIQVLALSEVRWPGNGSLQINENLILYSGLPTQQPDNRRSGVAIALGEEAIKAWKAMGAECDPISDRLLKARFKIHTGHLSVFAVYAPTNEEAQAEASEKFYEELQEAVCGVPRQDMLVIMGDFNARVGCDDEAWHGVIGRNGPNEKNSNGDRLLDFCALNNLVVTNTTFKHRPCHQYTWFHPAEEGKKGHILDYILVNHRFRSSILDTRVFRKTYLQSDHRL